MALEILQPQRAGSATLEVGFQQLGTECVLCLAGSLDAESVAVLEAQFDRLGRAPCRRVLLDVRSLESLDETGVRVLVGLHHYVRGRGGSLTLAGARGAVAAALAPTPLWGAPRAAAAPAR